MSQGTEADRPWVGIGTSLRTGHTERAAGIELGLGSPFAWALPCHSPALDHRAVEKVVLGIPAPSLGLSHPGKPASVCASASPSSSQSSGKDSMS